MIIFQISLKYTCYFVSFLTQELFLGCILTSAESREGPSKCAHQVRAELLRLRYFEAGFRF